MRVRPPRLVGLDQVPRASASIRRAKSMGGLAGFAASFLAAHLAGAGLASACLRGIAGGAVAYLVVWAVAVVVWRNLLVAEARRALSRRRKA